MNGIINLTSHKKWCYAMQWWTNILSTHSEDFHIFKWVVLDVLSPVHVLSELVAHDVHLVVFLKQIQTLVNLRRGICQIFTPAKFSDFLILPKKRRKSRHLWPKIENGILFWTIFQFLHNNLLKFTKRQIFYVNPWHFYQANFFYKLDRFIPLSIYPLFHPPH